MEKLTERPEETTAVVSEEHDADVPDIRQAADREEPLAGDGAADRRQSSGAFGRLVRTVLLIRSWALSVRRARLAGEGGRSTVKRQDSFLLKHGMVRDSNAMQHQQQQQQIIAATDAKKPPSRVERLCQWLVIDPSSTLYYRWLAVISVAVVYNVVFIIARSVFWKLQENYVEVWMTLDYMCDVIYILDMAVHFCTGKLEQGILDRDLPKLAQLYLLTTDFKLDIVSIFPTDLLYLITPPSVNRPYVRFNRLVKFNRLGELFSRLETYASRPYLFRILKMVIYILIMVHWNACFYIQMSEWIGFGSDQWVYVDLNDEFAKNGSLVPMYIYALYWSTLMLTSLGDLPLPTNEVENLFVIANFLIAVLIFATIVGEFVSISASMSQMRTDFQNRMDSVKRYMTLRSVEEKIQKRVLKWFDYVWVTNQWSDEQEMLSVLPDTLRAELAINVHLEALRRVTIFQSCEQGLLMKLVVRLRLVVYSPGDYVCRKGDVGTEMYIIKRGSLSVVADDGNTIYATLGEGGFFGEVSLLDIPGNLDGNRRMANVRSIGYSDLFVLSKVDLWSTLAEYPEAKKRLIEAGINRLKLDKKYNENATTVPSSLEQQHKPGKRSHPQKVLSLNERADKLEENIDKLVEEFSVLFNNYILIQKSIKQTITNMERKFEETSIYK